MPRFLNLLRPSECNRPPPDFYPRQPAQHYAYSVGPVHAQLVSLSILPAFSWPTEFRTRRWEFISLSSESPWPFSNALGLPFSKNISPIGDSTHPVHAVGRAELTTQTSGCPETDLVEIDMVKALRGTSNCGAVGGERNLTLNASISNLQALMALLKGCWLARDSTQQWGDEHSGRAMAVGKEVFDRLSALVCIVIATEAAPAQGAGSACSSCVCDKIRRSGSNRSPLRRPSAIRGTGRILGGHLKTGHQWTGQNRPPEAASKTG